MSAPTGIVYAQQYGGGSCLHGELEGFYIPLFAPESLQSIRQIFEIEMLESGTNCPGFAWAVGQRERVVAAIESIGCSLDGEGAGEYLQVDQDGVIDEAWVPVLTIAGPGMLVWENSD